MSELTIKSWADMPAATEITDTDNFLVLNEEGALGRTNCKDVVSLVPNNNSIESSTPTVYYAPIVLDTAQVTDFEQKRYAWSNIEDMDDDVANYSLEHAVSLQSVLRQAWAGTPIQIGCVETEIDVETGDMRVMTDGPIALGEIFGVTPVDNLVNTSYEEFDTGVTQFYTGACVNLVMREIEEYVYNYVETYISLEPWSQPLE